MPGAVLDAQPALGGHERALARARLQHERARTERPPASVWGLTNARWKGKIGIAPTNASFQAFLGATIHLYGEARVRAWLRGLEANDVRFYPNNTTVVQAVGRGDVEVGLVNHYYLYNLLAETPDLPVRNHWFRDGDPGNLVLAAGVGIVSSTEKAAAAQRFVDFLLSKWAQRFIARGPGAAEYPLVKGVPRRPGLAPLSHDQGPEVQPRPALGRPRARRCGCSSRRASSSDLAGAAAAVSSRGRRAPRLLVASRGARRARRARPDRLPDAAGALGRRGGARARPRSRRRSSSRGTRRSSRSASSWRRSSSASRSPGSSCAPTSRAGGSGGLAASLPLVIPSFVAALALLGALAPRGLVQEVLEPLGVERLPEVTGYWGALVALTLATYPYVYLLAAAGCGASTRRRRRRRAASAPGACASSRG